VRALAHVLLAGLLGVVAAMIGTPVVVMSVTGRVEAAAVAHRLGLVEN
jgi:hypothetical protein